MFKSVVCLTLSLLGSVAAMDTGANLPPAAAKEQDVFSAIVDDYNKYAKAAQESEILKIKIVSNLTNLQKTGQLREDDRAKAIEIANGIKSPSLATRLGKPDVNFLDLPKELTDPILAMATKGASVEEIKDMLNVSKGFQKLFLTAPIHLDFHDKQVTGDVFRKIALIFPNLISLDLGNTDITDAEIEQLKSFPNLTSLRLDYNYSITDGGLAYLVSLPNLLSLNLTEADITDAGLAHLGSLKKLTSLNLTRTAISAQGLAHLASLPNLTSLKLGHLRMDIGKALEQLKSFPRLTSLSLDEVGITSVHLEKLKSFKNLTYLSIKGAPKEVLESLQQALPNCKINSYGGLYNPSNQSFPET